MAEDATPLRSSSRRTAKSTRLSSYRRFLVRHEEMKQKIAMVNRQMKALYASFNALDLVIVMDCTGSMQQWVNQAKASILGIIDAITRDNPGASTRVGFVAYRDFIDGPNRLVQHPLTANIAAVRRFIVSLVAMGGGDGPEDIPGGLKLALEMEMTAGAKRLILVADAPCHGNQYQDRIPGIQDIGFEEEIAASPCIRQQMRELARRGVDVTFIEIMPHQTAKMAAILHREFESVMPMDGHHREFQRVPLAGPDDVRLLAATVSAAGTSSLQASRMRGVSLVITDQSSVIEVKLERRGALTAIGEEEEEERCGDGHTVDRGDPHPVPQHADLNWSDLDRAIPIAAIRHSYRFRHDAQVDWSRIDLKHSAKETIIKLLPTCFARGVMRSAHAMYDQKMDKRFVAKFYYGQAAIVPALSPLTYRENDVKAQIVAKRLATEFSLLPQVDDGVDFLFSSVYEIRDPTLASLPPWMTMCTAEPYISGEYKKYNNNNGWINARDASPLRDTAQAFSHFTWQQTLGQLMVVDLQGVGCIFTDPQIHSVDRRTFGRGNLSEVGMEAFFCTHRCNAVCEKLALLPFEEQDGAPVIPPSSIVANDQAESEETREKRMTCSCVLCGAILQLQRGEFVRAHQEKREVLCGDCEAKMEVEVMFKCDECAEQIWFSPYYHDMKGLDHPNMCSKCSDVIAIKDEEARTVDLTATSTAGDTIKVE